MNFRKLLLNRCQKEFEKDKDDDEIFEKKQKELEAASVVEYLLSANSYRGRFEAARTFGSKALF